MPPNISLFFTVTYGFQNFHQSVPSYDFQLRQLWSWDRHVGLCKVVGRGLGDGDMGTRVWGLGDARLGNWGHQVWDAGTCRKGTRSNTGTLGTRGR